MKLIVNADDFGRSTAINQAVERAHCKGILTSASLMVTGEAWQEARDLAWRLPSLAVGLHLVVAGGRSLLGPETLPHLVDDLGHFRGGVLAIGLRYACSRTARVELVAEMAAQFERFASTGLSLSHVDSHLHMHMHPVVFDLLLPLAVRYGARGVRVVRDEFWLSAMYRARGLVLKAAWAAVFGALAWRARVAAPILQNRGSVYTGRLAVVERVYGLMQTGCVDEAYLLRLLSRSRASTAELYCHPSVVPLGERLGPNPGDLAALVSPAVRQAVEESGHHLVTYRDLIGN